MLATETMLKDIDEIINRPVKFEEYELLVRDLPDTLDAHWETAEWCRRRNLDDERRIHLQRVLEYDPEHRRAHYGLGHTNHKGEWLTKEQYDDLRRAEGYVKFNGKWVAAEKLGSLQASDKRTKAELAWFQKVRVWMKQAGGNNRELAQDGLSNLKSIRNPDAIPALIQFSERTTTPKSGGCSSIWPHASEDRARFERSRPWQSVMAIVRSDHTRSIRSLKNITRSLSPF